MLDELFAVVELISETIHPKDKREKPNDTKPALTVRQPIITKRILSGRHTSIETKPIGNKATGCTHCGGWGSVLKQKTTGITVVQAGTGTHVSKYNHMTGQYEQIYIQPKYIEITTSKSPAYEPCPFCSGKD